MLKLMSESDYVVISTPLTVDTRKMINRTVLNACKPGQVLINLGRGEVIDEQALIAALQEGKLAGAALDVFAKEPLPETSQLWDLPNVLISPHNADQTQTSRYSSVKFFCENAERFINGQELLCIVDKQIGY